MNFTPAQLAAIDVSRRQLDACVVAGPGSGKTTVLVEYFRGLVESGADPLRILAITFTEKAAANMRKKLAEAFHGQREIRAKLERAWVSTVHGFCGRLLRENSVFAGIDPEFYVAAERESWKLQQESISGAMDELFRERPADVRALIRGLSSAEFEEAALSAYDAMRGAGTRVDQLEKYPAPPDGSLRDAALTLEELAADPADGWTRAQRQHLDEALEAAERVVSAASPFEALRAIEGFAPNLNKCKRGTPAYELVRHLREQIGDSKYSLITAHYAPQRELLFELLRRFDQLYRERKRRTGALDFADLEEFAARLLADDPEARARVQAQFDHILMDEFQDTNGQQAKLLELLRRPGNFYAVGDINQSIFGFRHAEPQVFGDYRKTAGAGGGRVVELAGNFRSRAEILLAVETIAEGLPGLEQRRLTAERTFDDRADAEAAAAFVECLAVSASDMDAALPAEARWVARRVLELGFEFQDVAVLVRNTEVIPEFAAAFEEAGVPYVVNRGRGFYDCREVVDLANLLRVVANPRDEIALAAVLRSPMAGVSPDALLQLKTMGENMGASLGLIPAAPGDAFDPEDHQRLLRFRERFKRWRSRREYVTFDRVLLDAIDDCGYRPESGARGAANIDKFLAQARDAAAQMSLDEFVEELALLRDANPREPDAPLDDSAAAVKIMTVHSAKGLEFPVVFVAALHKGVETEPPVVAFSPRIGLGARWRNPARREQKDDLFQHALRRERQRREEEESSRLLYVAMTRAEQRLILTFSGAGKKLQNWAAIVAESLHFDPVAPCDEVVTRTAPDGKEWKLRLVSSPALVGRAPSPAPDPLVRLSAELIRMPEEADEGVGRGPGGPPDPAPESTNLPAVTAQHDGNATVTALTEFAKCPRAYYLGHYLGYEGGRPRGQSDGIPAAELGSQVHGLLAGVAVPNADPEALRLADVFRRSPLGRRAAQARRVEREFDFLMAVEDLVIRGKVDLWFEDGGEIVLVDYKTDDVTRAQAHERARDYALQLRLYAMAVERVAGRAHARAWLHFLRPDTAVEVDLAPSLLDSPEQAVRDFQDAQASLDFPMNPGGRCRRCPFLHGLCPAVV